MNLQCSDRLPAGEASCYPGPIRQKRLIRREDDRPGAVLFETCLQGKLLMYSVGTPRACAAHIEGLSKAREDLCLMVLDNMVYYYGYVELAAAETDAEKSLWRDVY